MKKVLVSAIIALMAVSIRLYAQETEMAQEEQPVQTEEIRLELLWDREFDEELISATFTHEKTTVITENKIYCMDNMHGETEIFRATYQYGKEPTWRQPWVYPSQNGEYIGICHNILCIDRRGASDTYQRLAIVELMKNAGPNLWIREKEISVEAPYVLPTLYTSNQGYLVETDLDYNGKLRFYDPSGQMINEAKLSENTFEEYVTHRGSWSNDGEYFAIFTDEGAKNSDRYISYIILYTKEGKELWRYAQNKIGEGYCCDIAISPGNKYIGLFTRDNDIVVFDIHGSKFFTQNISKAQYRRIGFSPNGDEITVYSNVGVISNLSIQEKRVNWEKPFPGAEITSLQYLSDNPILVLGLRERAQTTTNISFFDVENRRVLSRIDFNEPGRSNDSLNKTACPLLGTHGTDYLSLIVIQPNRCLSYKVLPSQGR